MRAKIFILVLVAGAAALAFLSVFNDRAARREAEDALAQAELQRNRLTAEIRATEQRITTAESEQRRVQAQIEAARKTAAATKMVSAPRPAPTAAPMTALRDALLNDPRMQNLQLAAVQAKLRGTFQPLCERLHLSETQTAQFLAIMRKREEQEMDLSAIMETQQLAADDPVVARMKQQMSDEFRAAQRALLGETGLQEFETYYRAISAREFVNEVAGAAAILGSGITAAQADALAEAMANASSAYRQGRTATRNIGDIDWDRVLVDARGILSEAPLAVFQNAVIQSRNMDRIRQLARRK